jgi:hypothetical protein
MPTEQKTRAIPVINSNRQFTFTEIITVYCVEKLQQVNPLRGTAKEFVNISACLYWALNIYKSLH